MKKCVLFLLTLTLLTAANCLLAQGTAFTYQGQLVNNGVPANGNYDFTFALFNNSSGNTGQVGGTLTDLDVGVANGAFTVTLDFGSAFTGNAIWLAIGVRSNGVGGYIGLSPLQPLMPTPYAIFAESSGGVNNSSISAPQLNTVGVPTSGQVLVYNGTSLVWANQATGGGGSSNGWSLTGNAGTSPANGNFLGTTDNQALELHVNGQRALRLEPDNTGNGSPNVIGGAANNALTGSGHGKTICGGAGNSVGSSFATVGGGYGNTASGPGSFVGGGGFDGTSSAGNKASFGASTVTGGMGNSAIAAYAAIVGGYSNAASASDAFVGGGTFNTASGFAATVPGGVGNLAGGNYSFAAGDGAQAANDGSFVWADSSGGDFSSTTNNQFSVRADGGARFVTSGAGMTVDGAPVLTTGSGLPGLTIQTNSDGAPNFIGGSQVNFVASGVVGATISGGGAANYLGISFTNSVTADLGTVSGGVGNTSSHAATVGGGAYNTASGDYATVGGGYDNTSSNQFATVGGGTGNTSSGDSATVGGGTGNTCSDKFATVGGGVGNTSSSGGATVGGGKGNTSSNDSATVPGGWLNVAGGQYSFAAGQQAQALHQGAFVWADSQNAAFASTSSNQFLIRAQGGVGIGTGGPQAQLHVTGSGGTGFPQAQLDQQNTADYSRLRFTVGGNASQRWDMGATATNFVIYSATIGSNVIYLDQRGLTVSGTVNSSSDRNVKAGFEPVDAKAVLERLAAIPITRWHYTNDAATPHLGPMAQDFHAAFGTGADDKHIAVVDEGGVALAAIQGLNQKLEAETREKDAEIQKLKVKADKVDSLEKQLNELKEVVRLLAEKK